jgi:hypothetical protein
VTSTVETIHRARLSANCTLQRGPPDAKISASWGALGVAKLGHKCGCLESGGNMERAVLRSAEGSYLGVDETMAK